MEGFINIHTNCGNVVLLYKGMIGGFITKYRDSDDLYYYIYTRIMGRLYYFLLCFRHKNVSRFAYRAVQERRDQLYTIIDITKSK